MDMFTRGTSYIFLIIISNLHLLFLGQTLTLFKDSLLKPL